MFEKRTKIVVTIGPACDTEEKIKELILSGANVFRLNTSHGDINYHKEKIRLIKKVAESMGVYTATLVDLQGPKIRIGKFDGEIPLQIGQELILKHKNEFGTKKNIIPVDYEGISKDVKPKDIILADDGKIQFEVVEINGDEVKVKVTVPNILKPRKGLNIPGSSSSLNAVGEKDITFIEFAVNENADFIALSFVRKKEDVLCAKEYIKKFKGNIPIIAKLEKPQAMDNLEEIVDVSDACMVARGDLGIELSPVEVPVCQKKIINECNRQNKPVIVATQMLESMIKNPIPTRAESSDVANAVLDGADAVMLSGETSVGSYAAQAVKMMKEIIIASELSGFYNYDREIKSMNSTYAKTRCAIVYGADKMIEYTGAKAIISFSQYGTSTKIMSKIKPKAPIIMICNHKQSARRMALSWGVFPFYREWDEVITDNLILKFDEFLINEIGLQKDDYVIITGSQPKLIGGRTNFIRVHRIGA